MEETGYVDALFALPVSISISISNITLGLIVHLSFIWLLILVVCFVIDGIL